MSNVQAWVIDDALQRVHALYGMLSLNKDYVTVALFTYVRI